MPRDIFGNIVRTDMFGKKVSKKQIKREVISENRAKGRAGEDNFRTMAMMGGEEVERAPHGRDFIVRKRDPFTGRVTRTTHVEVKTGNAKLSKLQQKTKKKKSNYKVSREKPMFW